MTPAGSVPDPESGPECNELWLLDIAATAPTLRQIETIEPRLAPEQVAEFAAMREPGRAEARRTAQIALRLLLERHAGSSIRRCAFALSPAGKPMLAGTGVHFSLSHGPGCALIGLARHGPVGVDIEGLRAVAFAPARRRELMIAGALAGAAPVGEVHGNAAFLQAWTRLEALAKATGAGISGLLQALGLRERKGGAPAPDQAALAAAVVAYLRENRLTVTDIDAGAGRFAAAAWPMTASVPQLRRFPQCPDALAAIAAGPVAG